MTTSPGQGQPAASAPPSAGDAQGRAPRTSPPLTIMVFFWVQIALLIWEVVAMVAAFNSIKAQAVDTGLNSNHILTYDQIVANATNMAVIEEAVAAFFALLTAFVMFKVKAGRSWARSLVTLLSILLLILVVPMKIMTISITFESVAALAVDFVTVIAVVLLHLPSSNAYFNATRRHRTTRARTALGGGAAGT